jgi:hypothetical protein
MAMSFFVQVLNALRAMLPALFGCGDDLRGVCGRAWNDGGNALPGFFPVCNPYVIMEFASYLSYRGVPVGGAEAEPTELKNVA